MCTDMKAISTVQKTQLSLSTNEILDNYVCRWPIEVFFRQCKDKLALDSYQIRSAQGIRRYWLIMSFAHYMCVVGTGEVCPFETGYHKISDIIQMEKYLTLYQCARECNDFDSFVKVVVQFCAIFQICSFIVKKTFHNQSCLFR